MRTVLCGAVEFSDGSREKIEIKKQADPQTFAFKKRTVTWLRLTDPVRNQPLRWCAPAEVEARGKDAPPAMAPLTPNTEHRTPNAA